jgi:hypothetical protein
MTATTLTAKGSVFSADATTTPSSLCDRPDEIASQTWQTPFFSTATGKFAILLTNTGSFVMPAVIEQVNKMSAEEKLRLIAYIVESMTGEASRSASPTSGEQWRNGYPRPRVSDFIGYCQKFNHETRSTDEIMKELREGEE